MKGQKRRGFPLPRKDLSLHYTVPQASCRWRFFSLRPDFHPVKKFLRPAPGAAPRESATCRDKLLPFFKDRSRFSGKPVPSPENIPDGRTRR
ncbi:MAG: hypothetical protein C6W56_11195 [Caldibacillus debilis]|nr:MAG: hypothetical protein C6W56_11195 [Caldibacillus debilis]